VITCQHCGAETSNGLALCELCQRKAATVFEFLPIYFRNLARWRPGRAGSRPVPGSRVLYDGHEQGAGTGDRISDTLDETANALITWAGVLVEERPHLARLLDRLNTSRHAQTITEAEAIAWLCVGFEKYLTSISTTDWCGEFVRDLDQHEQRLRALTEAFVPGWYAGGCRQLVGFDDQGAAVRCDSGTYVVPGLTWVTCAACGTTTYARDHLERIRDEASAWVAPPKRLAEAIVALVDTEQSVPNLYDRIRQWASRDRLTPVVHMARGYVWDDDAERMVVGDVQVGRARYRLGDVLDVLHKDTTARRVETVAKAG
jgi:hypothetical protein